MAGAARRHGVGEFAGMGRRLRPAQGDALDLEMAGRPGLRGQQEIDAGAAAVGNLAPDRRAGESGIDPAGLQGLFDDGVGPPGVDADQGGRSGRRAPVPRSMAACASGWLRATARPRRPVPTVPPSSRDWGNGRRPARRSRSRCRPGTACSAGRACRVAGVRGTACVRFMAAREWHQPERRPTHDRATGLSVAGRGRGAMLRRAYDGASIELS